jgi:hypothetical protein
MSLTIVLSGPKIAESQARTALASHGYTILAGPDSHGLPDTRTGEAAAQPVRFITVTGDSLDATDCVAGLGYLRRMHHETQPPPEPSVEERLLAELAALRADVDRLKAGG